MKVEDLVIGKYYRKYDRPGQDIEYKGTDDRFFPGQHEFKVVNVIGDFNGCIATDDEVEEFIHEINERSH